MPQGRSHKPITRVFLKLDKRLGSSKCAVFSHSSILKRLGIDESVDYTKPLILDPPMGTPNSLGGGPPSSGSQVIPPYPAKRPRSTSSSDKSEETCLTKPQSGCSPALSPARSTVSSNSLSPPPNNSNNSQTKDEGSKSSLSALSSMFESIGGSGGGNGGSSGNHSDHMSTGSKSSTGNNTGISQQGHHPLAALQKLCDIKSDVSANANSSRPQSTSSNHSNHSFRDGPFNATSPGTNLRIKNIHIIVLP